MFSLLLNALNPSDQAIVVDGALCRADRLLVQIAAPQGEKSIAAAGYEIVQRFPQIGYVTIRVPYAEVSEARSRLRAQPGIGNVQLDYAKQLAYVPNDPLWGQQWHLRTIKADAAWDTSLGIPITVAVIDTGVRLNHEDLAANIWVNQFEIPGNLVDDDRNGYVDDINGYDFVDIDNDPSDQAGHGTGCAGIVAAVQDNQLGISGVAPRAKIMAMRATNNQGLLFDSYLIPSYFYAAANGAKVFSMSYFSDRVSDAEKQALDYCWRRGVLPVAAAGNDNTLYPYYPAGYENVLAVAATNPDNTRAGFSDYGSWVDVAAPGVGLITTGMGGGYGGFSGTSGACPHVSGLAALLFGSRQKITNWHVRNAIEDTAMPLTEVGVGEYVNYGLIDCQAALNVLLSGLSPIRDSVVRYITPHTPEASTFLKRPPTRIYGRGFQAPHQVSVTMNGIPWSIISRTRDYVDVNPTMSTGTLNVVVDGDLKMSVAVNSTARIEYAAAEIGTKGATMYDGFYSRLCNPDGAVATCTRRSDGRTYVQGTFRLVRATPSAAINGSTLTIRRRYSNTAGGSEHVYLYNWSTASFPYGNYVELGSMAAPTSMTTTTYAIPNLAQFIDFEGTIYLLIDTGGLDDGATGEFDQIVLSKPRT